MAKKSKKEIIEKIMGPLEKAFGNSESNVGLRGYLEGLSQPAFDGLMNRMKAGDWVIPYTIPNLSKDDINFDKALDFAKSVGEPIYHQIIEVDPETGEESVTPYKYPVIDLPVRRYEQHQLKKISVAEDDRHVDHITGQPAGPSKGSSISLVETMALANKGMDQSLVELLKIRGGDYKAYNEMLKSVVSTGGFSVESISELGTKPKVTESLTRFFLAMHYTNNLDKPNE